MTSIRLATELSERLAQIIDATEAEFNRLVPDAQRSACGSFEAKTGQPIAMWRDTAASLTALLEKMGECDAAAEATFHSSYPRTNEGLSKLIAYYHEAPVEIASLTGDTDLGVLRDVAFYSPQRVTSLRFLLDSLERLAMRMRPIPTASST